MLSFWIEFAINLFVGILRAVVKNPASYAGLLKVLQDVDADLQEAIAALEGQGASPAPPTAPPSAPAATPKKP